MRPGERIRLGFVFGLLGVVPLFLLGWLGYVQVAQAAALQRQGRPPLRLTVETAASEGRDTERAPARRGTIVDRDGRPLAFDREVYEVRAVISVPSRLGKRGDRGEYRAWLGERAGELALALASDPGLADRRTARQHHEERLRRALFTGFRVDEAARPGTLPWTADVLVANRIDVLSVIEALRAYAARRDRCDFVTLHFLPSFTRAYPDRELTYGIVGHTNTAWQEVEGGGRELVTYGVAGLEAASVLGAGSGAARPLLRDGRGRTYFVAQSVAPSPTPVLHSTLDLELQRAAMDELATQAEAGAREGKVTIPKWGALVLVEVATGDVVAAASWHRGEALGQNTSFTPYQSLYEPGSIVKPLVLAYAYEAGVLDWNHVFDCSPDGADYRERIRGLGRRTGVRDDHECHDLSAHGILVNSSNIGASFVGLLLAREQWRDYMRFFGFGESLGLPLPHERNGGPSVRSFAAGVTERSFRANSAISFSFGYEFHVTALQMARAYLRLLRGGRSELRVCRGVELDGEWIPAPASPAGATFSPRVSAAVRSALVDVMSPDEHATGSHVRRRIEQELGIDVYGLIAGKTGTAASLVGIPRRGQVNVRNASFVGVIPATSPRWLAVCVLQKDDSARFYGGSYAAPPAVRLLLRAERLAERRRGGRSPRPSDGQIR